MLGCRIGIHHRLDERVAGQTVAAVQTCTRTFAHGIEALDARLSVQVHLNAATHVVRARSHGDVVLRDVDADAQALGIDVGEMVLRLLGILMRHVQTHMVEGVNLHLVVDGTSHDVAWGQREAFVILLHELLAVGQSQDAAIAAHGLGDEVGRMGLQRVVENRGMELHKLHVLHLSLGTIDHGDAVARCDIGVRGSLVDGSRAACRHERHLRQVGVHLARLGVQHVGTEAFDVGSPSGHTDAQMVLRDDFHCEMMLQHLDVRMISHRLHQSSLNLCTRVVGMVQDAKLRVTSFTMQVKLAVLLLVEVHTPAHQVFDARRTAHHHLLHRLGVANPVARNHRVLDVLLKVVHQQVRHRSDAALRLRRVRLLQRGLAEDGNLALLGLSHFQGITHTSHSRADNEKIILLSHIFYFSISF